MFYLFERSVNFGQGILVGNTRDTGAGRRHWKGIFIINKLIAEERLADFPGVAKAVLITGSEPIKFLIAHPVLEVDGRRLSAALGELPFPVQFVNKLP